MPFAEYPPAVAKVMKKVRHPAICLPEIWIVRSAKVTFSGRLHLKYEGNMYLCACNEKEKRI